MAVWIDPVIEFIVREAHQDMPTIYQEDKENGLHVTPLFTDQSRIMALAWNEGEIVALYNMEQQGVYVSVKFEPQIIGYQKRQVGRAMYDFENALIGTPEEPQQAFDANRALAFYPNGDPIFRETHPHHNVGGHPIRQEDMVALGLEDTYGPLTENRAPPRNDGKWWPDHIIQKVTVESTSIKFDPNINAWRGRLFIHAHIANAGFGGID